MTAIAMEAEEAAAAYQIEPGRTHPLGAIPDQNGVNFSVFADRATSVELLLFDEHDDTEPVSIIVLDPNRPIAGAGLLDHVPDVAGQQVVAEALSVLGGRDGSNHSHRPGSFDCSSVTSPFQVLSKLRGR